MKELFRFRNIFTLGGTLVIMAYLYISDPNDGGLTLPFLAKLATPVIAVFFAHWARKALFDYLDEFDSELEFDPIAICCDFSQCSLDEFEQANPTIEEIQHDKGLTLPDAIEYFISHNGFWFAFVEDGKEIIFENF